MRSARSKEYKPFDSRNTFIELSLDSWGRPVSIQEVEDTNNELRKAREDEIRVAGQIYQYSMLVSMLSMMSLIALHALTPKDQAKGFKGLACFVCVSFALTALFALLDPQFRRKSYAIIDQFDRDCQRREYGKDMQYMGYMEARALWCITSYGGPGVMPSDLRWAMNYLTVSNVILPLLEALFKQLNQAKSSLNPLPFFARTQAPARNQPPMPNLDVLLPSADSDGLRCGISLSK